MQQTLREITPVYLWKERISLLFTSFSTVPLCCKLHVYQNSSSLYCVFYILMNLFLELLITLVIWIYLENIQMEWIPPHPPPHQKSPSLLVTLERWCFGSISMYLIIKNAYIRNLLKIIIFNKILFQMFSHSWWSCYFWVSPLFTSICRWVCVSTAGQWCLSLSPPVWFVRDLYQDNTSHHRRSVNQLYWNLKSILTNKFLFI